MTLARRCPDERLLTPPIRDRSGRLIGVVMVFHDVSQERRLQRALSYQATRELQYDGDVPAGFGVQA